MSIRLNSDIYIYNNKYQIITFQFTSQMAELPYKLLTLILLTSHSNGYINIVINKNVKKCILTTESITFR